MKIIKTASGKRQIKISKSEWESIGRKSGWTREAAPVAGAPVAGAPAAVGEQLQGAMDTKVKTVFMKALQGTGLSKQKVMPFLEQLIQGLSDVPLSKVTSLMKALAEDPEVQ